MVTPSAVGRGLRSGVPQPGAGHRSSNRSFLRKPTGEMRTVCCSSKVRASYHILSRNRASRVPERRDQKEHQQRVSHHYLLHLAPPASSSTSTLLAPPITHLPSPPFSSSLLPPPSFPPKRLAERFSATRADLFLRYPSTISAVTIPNMPCSPSACERMWQWNAHAPASLHSTITS